MNRLHKAFAASALIAGLATDSSAQQVKLTFDDVNPCSSTPLTTYAGWINLTAGVTCKSSPSGWTGPSSTPNYLSASLSMGWNFLGGPVVFDGLYASGFGTYFMELLSGGTTVFSGFFTVTGSPKLIASTYGGNVDQVKLRVWSGSTTFGVDDVKFTPPAPPPPPPPGPDNSPPADESPPSNESFDPISTATVNPEPATMLLMATGLSGLGAALRRRRRPKGK